MAWKRSSGNSLNGAGAKLASISYEFDEIKGVKDKKKTFTKATAEVAWEVDGVDDPITRYYEVGFLPDGAKLNKDKKTFTADKPIVSNGSDFDKLVGSAIEGGFPESDIEEGEGKDFSMLEGIRVILKVEADREKQIRIGKDVLAKKGKKNPTDEEAMEAGKRKVTKGEHKGKEFDRELVLVGKVVGEDEGGSSAKSSKKSKAVEADEDTDTDAGSDDSGDGIDTDRKDEVLRAILADAKDNTLPRGRISGAIVTWAVDNDVEKEEREALRAALYDEDYLTDAADRGIITYDAEDKKQPVTLKKGKKR